MHPNKCGSIVWEIEDNTWKGNKIKLSNVGSGYCVWHKVGIPEKCVLKNGMQLPEKYIVITLS